MDIKKEFTKMFEELSYRHGKHGAFSDWLEVSSLTMAALNYHKGYLKKDKVFQEGEERYLKVVSKYNSEELTLMGNLLGLMVTKLPEYEGDFLGEIYMELEMGNKDGGQFFTPYHLCLIMAKLQLLDAKEL